MYILYRRLVLLVSLWSVYTKVVILSSKQVPKLETLCLGILA